jgi:hypothetical protein
VKPLEPVFPLCSQVRFQIEFVINCLAGGGKKWDWTEALALQTRAFSVLKALFERKGGEA